VSVNRSICPDIYHPAVARDGLLTRLRIPGGILTGEQCLAAAYLLEATGVDYFQVTNRANLQLRGLEGEIAPGDLQTLIAEGLVAANKAVDGIRNIMASPISGIDPTELIDVRPLVAAWDKYLIRSPELGVLSNKFSVGFDGGGSVSILDRPNDITLLAVSESEFLLHLAMGMRGEAPVSVGVRLGVDECIPLLGAIASSYRRGIEELGGDERRKPRLRAVIAAWGLERFQRVVELEWKAASLSRWSATSTPENSEHATKETFTHLGVWQQQQTGLSYMGVVLPLGRLNSWQLSRLSEIACEYGSGTIRLTPWQNAIVSDIRDEDVAKVQELIEALGLGIANNINGLLMACAGASGCQFGATDTQRDAIELSEYLESKFSLDRSVNIHFSGCDKSCAQHYQADIALWGCPQTAERKSGYRLCIGGGDDKFGRELWDYLTPEDVRLAIDRLIRAYQERRVSPQESFRAFTDRQSLAQLQQVFHVI
jgi:ferredoxin-nitrite reductase